MSLSDSPVLGTRPLICGGAISRPDSPVLLRNDPQDLEFMRAELDGHSAHESSAVQ